MLPWPALIREYFNANPALKYINPATFGPVNLYEGEAVTGTSA